MVELLYCRSRFYQRFLFIFILGHVMAASLLSHSIGFVHARELVGTMRKTLAGQTIPALRGLPVQSFLTGNATLHLSISLQMRNEAGLHALLGAQNDPRSSWYHRYLTPQEFTRRFGADPATVKMVSTYMQQQGLHVVGVAPNRLLMNVDGPLPAVERTFGVRIAQYRAESRIVYAPTTVPSLPSVLADRVVHVGGLDSVVSYRPFHRLHVSAQNEQARTGYTPLQLRTAYGIQPLLQDGEDGTNQTIAFVELDGFKPTDIANFAGMYLPAVPKYRTILLDGATNVPRSNAAEVELDMEVTAAIAPGAEQILYIGQNSAQGINDIYTRIVNDDLAKVVSTSWGTCEAALDPSEHAVLNTIFEQGAAQGQAFFAAAGDLGAYDCQNYMLAVDSPADNPYVVGVGGTSLTIYDQSGGYKYEKAWSCSSCLDGGPYGNGGGGGVSSIYSRPSYQSGPGIYSLYRAVPDVSANADPEAGYKIYCTVQLSGCPTSGWMIAG
ncbi:MAG TPA: protease pro-enzyme activation domain-containing protein, partial [Ktedonobacteraceae bacterium]